MAKIKNIDELFDMIFAEMDSKEISAELSKAARRKAEKDEQQKKELKKQKEICDARVKAVEAYTEYFRLLSPDIFDEETLNNTKNILLRDLKELELYFKNL